MLVGHNLLPLRTGALFDATAKALFDAIGAREGVVRLVNILLGPVVNRTQ
jgi:hypothetical protein